MSVAVRAGNVTACLWCREPYGERADHLTGRTRCQRCGAATTDPFPSEAELEAAYGDWYRPATERRFFVAVDALLARSRGWLASRLDRLAPPGPVLDVGAGDGILVDALRARGREAVGLERSPNRADFIEGSVGDVDGEWAAVVFWHSLEHLPDASDAIEHAARLVVPGGLIAVAVPNNDSVQARAFGDRWLHLDMPRHVLHLSTASLEEGLRRNGLEVEHVSYLRAGQTVIGWLQGLVGKLPGRPDLYQALRRTGAREVDQPASTRALAIAGAVVLLPVATLAALGEMVIRRGGTVYVEARRG
jgi:SAM-dependent methyltransferase